MILVIDALVVAAERLGGTGIVGSEFLLCTAFSVGMAAVIGAARRYANGA